MYGPFFSWGNDFITGQLKQYSAHRRNELAMIKSFLREGDDVIDIGTHIGTFCIPFAKSIGEEGRVFAFEANPHNYELLQRNIQENSLQGKIRPVCAIVSEKRCSFKKVLPSKGSSSWYYFLPQHNHEGQE